MQNKGWQFLKAGDAVELIAPAGRLSAVKLAKIVESLISWGLRVNLAEDIFGDDVLCAHSDEMRLKHLTSALFNPETKAVLCVRGGYGAGRLMPELLKLPPPSQAKLFFGMSDITALHIFLQQQWGWATVHGSMAVATLAPDSIAALKAMLLGEITHLELTAIEPFNKAAEQSLLINSTLVGGNLSLIQTSVGTAWQLNAHNKIILLEEINERAYKVDRMLEHLYQANIFAGAKAVIFGDFIGGEEPDGTSLIKPVLQRFAAKLPIPVLQITGIGHGSINYPVPFGTAVKLQLGDRPLLDCRLNSI
jgi:muramoyltetrapeptide carboxypeptidase